MLITVADIKKLIQEAKSVGADPAEIQELQDHLLEIESGKFASRADAVFAYEKTEADGIKTVWVSTAPIRPEDDDDFKDISPKEIEQH